MSYNKSKYGSKDQESIQSSTTPDPGYQWESDKVTVRHHKREPRGQPFPASDHKAYINRRAQRHSKHKTEKKNIHKGSTALERSVKHFTGGLKPVPDANRTHNSDVDQDTNIYLVCMKDS